MNERGDIVGLLWTENQNEVLGQRAVLWTNGAAVDLNERIPAADAAQFVLAEAQDVNERGQIVGWGVDLPFDPFDDTERAFLLTPAAGSDRSAPPAPSVPRPVPGRAPGLRPPGVGSPLGHAHPL